MAPQRQLEQTGFHPGVVHLIDLLGLVPLLGEERLQGERHRENEREQIAKRHDGRRGGSAVGLILLGTMVAEADLVLIVEPLLIVLGLGRVENPLAEALADSAQIVTQRLAVALAEE